MYIKVAENETDEEVELPCEPDNTVLLSTLTSSFPGASGLKYRNEESGTVRGLRLIDGKLQPPEGGWSSSPKYFCCFPKGGSAKRKLEEDEIEEGNDNGHSFKSAKKSENDKRNTDLIVLGLAWRTTDQELKNYFAQYGNLVMAQVKRDSRNGQSKGFGFIRFADTSSHAKVLSTRHCIDGRNCDVRVPVGRDQYGNPDFTRHQEYNRRIFIGRLTEEITSNDLKEYFSKHGEVADIFIPKPFRGFAFLTFKDIAIAHNLCGEDHMIKGVSLHVSNAVPKCEQINNFHGGGPGSFTGYGKPYDRFHTTGNGANYNHRGGSGGYNSYPGSSPGDRAFHGSSGAGGGYHNYSPNEYGPPGSSGFSSHRGGSSSAAAGDLYSTRGNGTGNGNYGSHYNSSQYSSYY